MARFVACFNNAGTASNYVGFVKWSCTFLGLSVTWWDQALTDTLKGLRKESLRVSGGPCPARFLLVDKWVRGLCALAAASNDMVFRLVVLLGSVFLPCLFCCCDMVLTITNHEGGVY